MSDKMKISSPSRTYVACCNKMNFDGHYFRRFTLPEEDPWQRIGKLENDTENAAWYFLNRLNFVACIDGVFTAEDFANCKEEDTGDATDDEVGMA